MARTKLTWVVAGIAIATVVTASAVSATNGSDATPTQQQLDVRSLLGPANTDLGVTVIEASLAEAAERGLNKVPDGVTYAPATCASYLEAAIPDLAKADGHLRMTHQRFDPNSWGTAADHENFRLELVAHVPGGIDLDRIKAAIDTCADGTVTVGDARGTVAYTERETAKLPDTRTISYTTTVSFPAQDAKAAASLAAFGFGDGSPAAVEDEKVPVVTVAGGDTLLYVMSSSPEAADQRIAELYGNYLAATG